MSEVFQVVRGLLCSHSDSSHWLTSRRGGCEVTHGSHVCVRYSSMLLITCVRYSSMLLITWIWSQRTGGQYI